MIEGGGSADFATVRRMAYARPDLLARLVDVNARAVAAYLNEQIAAGAEVAMVFDTWGGLLSADAYRRFSLAPMRAVLEQLAPAPDGRKVPTIVFTKGGAQWLDDIAACGASAVGLDWTADLADARRRVGAKVTLQGNLDPLVLLTDPETVARAAGDVVRAAGSAPGHVFNLGHGIVPSTPPENVAALVEAVHRESRAIRAAA
jgi:uroporphyrinogen decarboxylase